MSAAEGQRPACCGWHVTKRPDGHCDWTCCEHRDDEGNLRTEATR